MLAIRNQKCFGVNRLKYLEEAKTLYGTYTTNSIDQIVDVINQLHKNISYHEKIINGKMPHWYMKIYYE